MLHASAIRVHGLKARSINHNCICKVPLERARSRNGVQSGQPAQSIVDRELLFAAECPQLRDEHAYFFTLSSGWGHIHVGVQEFGRVIKVQHC